MKSITQKEIKLKIGKTLPKGLRVSFNEETPSRCFVHDDAGNKYQVRITSAFHSPSMEDLEEWNNDGQCESVLGEMTEPDGWDEHGSPSWLLAMGLI